MNIAVIDIGTNSFHLIVANVDSNNYKIIHHQRIVFHLRSKSDSIEHYIVEDKVNEALEIIRKFYETANQFKAIIYAFGTSALRDATNKNDFILKVKKIFNIDVQLLSGEEEAQLIIYAINYHYNVQNENILIFDLGGGSTEIVLQNKGKVKSTNSLNLGAVRQTQKWFNNFTFNEENISNCIKEIDNELNAISYNDYLAQVFGIGGTITAVTWLIEKHVYNREHNFKIIPNYTISKRDFFLIKEMIINYAIKNELNKLIGIDDQRLSIILAGVLILDRLIEKFNIQNILATGVSIREAFLIKKFFANE